MTPARALQSPPGILLRVEEPEEAARWLKQHLFFEERPSPATETRVLANGNCVLYLTKGDAPEPPAPKDGEYATGLAHIALNTRNVEEAFSDLRQKGLPLESIAFNPKVFGEGEDYFQFMAPFGVRFEVSQKRREKGRSMEGKPLLSGLDHVGLPSASLEAEMAFFEERGFSRCFEPVTNANPVEGTIRCVMLESAGMVLEIYQFMDWTPQPGPAAPRLEGLVGWEAAVSPGGVALL